MKKSFILFAASLLALAGCSRNQEIDIQENGLSLFARTESPAETKTVVESGAHVFWEPGDEIAVFMGEKSAKFTTDITASSATATFKGTFGDTTWPEELDLWAVYPFSQDAVFDGETITTVLPSEQIAREGSFGKDMNLSIAHSTSNSLQFYNVGGGIRFSVTEDGIKKVMFEGLSGEIISGKVKIGFENGLPVVKEVTGGSQFITLLPPVGKETFEKDTWYYIVAIPGTLEKGYKLRFFKDTDYARKVSNKAAVIKRSIFGNIENADSGIEYEAQTTHFPETIEEIRESEQVTINVCHQINKIFTQFGFPDTKSENLDIQSIINAICQIDGVLSAVLEDSHSIITITKNDGTIIHFDFEDDDEEALTSENVVSDETINNLLAHEIPPTSTSNSTSKTKKALLLSPFQDSYKVGWKQKGKLTVNKQKLEEVLNPLGYSLDPFFNSNASLEKFSFDFLSNYDLILIITHGGDPDCFEYTTLISGSEIGQFPEEYAYLYDKSEVYCGFADDIPRYLVQAGWIEAFQDKGKKLPGSIVYVGACHSYEVDDLKNYLIENGASAYYGFDQAVPLNSTIDVIPTIDIMYSIIRSFCRGMDASAAYDYSKIDKDLWTTAFNLYVNYFITYGPNPWKFENFRLNPEAQNKNVFLVDPRPKELKANVSGNTASLSWKCDYVLDACKYMAHTDGRNFSLNPALNQSVSVPFDNPGTYPWSVVTNVYARTTSSNEPIIVATYRVDGEPFTVDKVGEAIIEILDEDYASYCRVGQNKNVSFTIRNKGDAALVISGVYFQDDDMTGSFNWTTATINPNESKELVVTYSPLHSGPHRPSINIYSNASNPNYSYSVRMNYFSFDCYGQHAIPSYSDEMVDLGLSVKWAACDLGTSTILDFGEHYAWGETDRKSSYSWDNYKWCNGSDDTITKYSYYEGPYILDNADDAATVHLGEGWRMPTQEECQELIDNCQWRATERDGVPVFEVTSRKNGNKIYFMRWLNTVGMLSDYWANSLWSDDGAYDFALCWYGGTEDCNPMLCGMGKAYGALIRPVYQRNSGGSSQDAPSISISATSMDFGSVPIGYISGKQTVSITNKGNADLNVKVQRCTDGFIVSPEVGSSFTLGPGKTRSGISVNFEPYEKKYYSGSVVFTTNDPNHPTVSISVMGSGYEEQEANPSIRISEDPVRFGTVSVGSSRTKTISVTNTGDSDLHVNTVKLLSGNEGFSLSGWGNQNKTISPGESASLSITFSPSVIGDVQDQILIKSDAVNTSHTLVYLYGTGN